LRLTDLNTAWSWNIKWNPIGDIKFYLIYKKEEKCVPNEIEKKRKFIVALGTEKNVGMHFVLYKKQNKTFQLASNMMYKNVKAIEVKLTTIDYHHAAFSLTNNNNDIVDNKEDKK